MSRLSMSTDGAWKVEQSPQTNVISDPAMERQNRLKILMEKPFQPSVTDVYSEIGEIDRIQ